jgi:hypothetical protein
VLAAAADYQAVHPLPAFQRLPVLEAGRVQAPWRCGAAGDEIVGARRQGERRNGRAHLYRKGRQLDGGDQLDRRAPPGRLVGHGQDGGRPLEASAGSSRRRSSRWACGRFRARCWRTSRSKSRAGKRPDIEHRGFEGLAGLSSEEARDTAATRRVILRTLRRLHQHRVGRVLHVAELPGLMGTGLGGARRCRRVGSARQSRRRSRSTGRGSRVRPPPASG